MIEAEIYVIQKNFATHLHYDLRLKMELSTEELDYTQRTADLSGDKKAFGTG